MVAGSSVGRGIHGVESQPLVYFLALTPQENPCAPCAQVVVGSSLDSVFMVMEYADHDLKAVMEGRMTQPFSVAEVGECRSTARWCPVGLRRSASSDPACPPARPPLRSL